MNFALASLLALAALNLWAFTLFGWDKLQAEDGGWRVSERKLLALALIGGIGGVYAGRAFFRHKTRKKSFNDSLQYIGFGQLFVLTFCGVYFYAADSAGEAGVQTAMAKTDNFAYYANCTAARRAGVAPLYRGDPGYRPEMDRDQDGIACEPYYGR
jgi:uncharacterized membrane protein YsdA (DUF1294 family)